MNTGKRKNSIHALGILGISLGLMLGGLTLRVSAGELTEHTKSKLVRKFAEDCSKLVPRIERHRSDPSPETPYDVNLYLDALIDLAIHSQCLSQEDLVIISALNYPSDDMSPFKVCDPQNDRKGTVISCAFLQHIETIGSSVLHNRNPIENFFEISFRLNKEELSCIVKFKQDSSEQAKQIGLDYGNSLADARKANGDTSKGLLYRKTRVEVHGDQVYIITNLKRADYDTLQGNVIQ